MARQPFRPVELSEALRPVAAPVDTFIHAQEPSRDSSLQDLARSLSGLGGSLAGMVGEREAKAREDDKVRANADFWQNNGTGAAEAVAKGLIPAQASPAYLKAYKQLEGEVAGGQLEQKFASAYDTWEGKTSTDPKAYDAFLGAFLKENIKSQDPDVLRGIEPKVSQLRANYLQRHIGDASKALQTGYTTALSARGEQAIDDANLAGLASHKGTDYAGVFGKLEAIRADGLKIGANQEQTDQKLIDTVAASAIAKRDPKLLDFLDRKVPGQDYTWSNTPYGRDQKAKTIDALETMGRKSIADEEKKNREQESALKKEVTRETIKAITANPNGPLPEELLAKGEKVDADFRVNAITWRNTIAKAGGVSDPEAILGVTSDIINGGGIARVQRGMRDGVFKNAADLTRAYKLAESLDKGGADLGSALSGGSAKVILDTIKVRTAGKKDVGQMFDDGSVSPEGLQAQTDFKLQVLAWREAHPNANAIEQEKAISGLGADILKRIVQSGDGGAINLDRTGIDGPNTFGAKAAPKEMPEGEAPATPTSPSKPPAAPGRGPVFGDPSVNVPSGLPVEAGSAPTPAPAPPPAPAPASPKAPVDPEAATDWFNREPPETRAAIEMKAAKEKKPLSLMVQEVYQKGIERGIVKLPAPATPTTASPPGKQSRMQAPDGAPIETASTSEDEIGRAFREAIDPPATPDTVKLMGEAFERALAATGKPQGNYSAATLRDDPKAARILDFVAGPESGGNYNAFYNNARSTKDLSAMTLDQVMAWSGSRGTESSATGRYQFMKATLRGLKTEMGLSGSEPFSPALQDRMALQLLNRRGYSEWQAGRITDAQFANRLALEWASLPNITAQNGRPAGVSAYAGDGLNRSSVSPASVLGALTGVFRRGMRAVSPRPRDGETSI